LPRALESPENSTPKFPDKILPTIGQYSDYECPDDDFKLPISKSTQLWQQLKEVQRRWMLKAKIFTTGNR
jgi:hypothetical protein